MRLLLATFLVACQSPAPTEVVADVRAPAVHATVEITAGGARLTDAAYALSVGALPTGPVVGTLEVLAHDGRVLHTVDVPDVRLRTIIAPDHGGEAALSPLEVLTVPVAWSQDAHQVRLAGTALVPRTPLLPIGALATRVVGAGDSQERLDLLFLGDGYTAAEQGKFEADVETMVDHLLSIEPYAAYADLFNAWRYFQPSAEPGADHPEWATPISRDTTYDCAYDCGGTDRLICCNGSAVHTAASQALPGTDGIMVLVNDTTYGGSGGSTFGTTYTGNLGPEVMAHEMGHSLLGLWDEYSYGGTWTWAGGPNCDPDPAVPTWSHWVGSEGVGAQTPCSYDNLHRPTSASCMMNQLRDLYCPVCREHAVREIYRRIPGLIAQTTPTQGAVAITGPTEFDVQTILGPLGSGPWVWSWTLDGQLVSQETTYEHAPCDGAGVLRLSLHDPTPWVRSDPQGLLEDSVTWTLTDDACGPGLVLLAPEPEAGESVELRVEGATPNRRVFIAVSTVGPGSGPCPAPGVCLDVLSPNPLAAQADATGVAMRTIDVPASFAGRTVWMQPITLSPAAKGALVEVVVQP